MPVIFWGACISAIIAPSTTSLRAFHTVPPKYILAPDGADYGCQDNTPLHQYKPEDPTNKCKAISPATCGDFETYCPARALSSLCCCRRDKVKVFSFGSHKSKKSKTKCTSDKYCPDKFWPLLDASPDLCAPEHSDRPYFVGEGSFGRVAKAKRVIFQQSSPNATLRPMRIDDIAVKVVNHKPEDVELAEKECKIVSAFSKKHESVLQTYDCGRAEIRGQPAFVFFMEFARGGNLEDKVYPNRRHVRLDRAVLKKYMLQMARAVHHIHSEYRVAHRDIKPENFMVATGRDGEVVKLIDFGFAATVSNTPIQCAGTPSYVAPEDHYTVVKGRNKACRISLAADVWSLGISFFVMYFGWLPCGQTTSDRILSCIEAPLALYPRGLVDPQSIAMFTASHLATHYHKTYRGSHKREADVELLDLLNGMMSLNPSRRMTMKDVLQHRYLRF
eukprot:TRINITY_DN40316_c0_g1_i1.p1 TRINITY_DN40316_c0_g1~~TRINITY_DN40316_c0_g1_i1.p1  ORF type:complete len:446 (-),score=34.35 TRINITY_DN40316_c0_g1_i1:203-1540(-)